MTRPTAPTAPHEDQAGDRAALLIIDMINLFDFDEGETLKARALDAARSIQHLRESMREREMPVIYVNDNFGEWHSERSRLFARAMEQANPVAEMLEPGSDDYFVIKPQFSGFYATNLPVLLPKLGVTQLVLTGIATDVCVLFTAADAHMRNYRLWVPGDAVASPSPERGEAALAIMAANLGAETARTQDLTVGDWLD